MQAIGEYQVKKKRFLEELIVLFIFRVVSRAGLPN
jgi:hypothetical protein